MTSDWFKDYCEHPDNQYIGVDGWPASLPKLIADTIERQLSAYKPASADIWRATYDIHFASVEGRNQARPAGRRATAKATESQLRTLHELCEELVRHIDGINSPAVSALWAEGFDLGELRKIADLARDRSIEAFGEFDAINEKGTSQRKPEASRVSIAAAIAYNRITGKRPTFTYNDYTKSISGEWPDFLTSIFAALRIDPSVDSQCHAIMKQLPKSWWDWPDGPDLRGEA